jgi:hypothetical protein
LSTGSEANKLSFPTPTQHIFSITTEMVTAILTQPTCGV